MKRAIALALALSIVLLLCGCASNDYKKAVNLYEAGNYEEAKVLFEKNIDYEDSIEYIKNIEVLLDPVGAIEAECESIIRSDKKLWSAYMSLLDSSVRLGIATSGGNFVFETKYDEQSNDFACLVDIPYMNGNEVFMHYYFGFAGHLDVPNVIITNIESIEFTESKVDSFWARYWNH